MTPVSAVPQAEAAVPLKRRTGAMVFALLWFRFTAPTLTANERDQCENA